MIVIVEFLVSIFDVCCLNLQDGIVVSFTEVTFEDIADGVIDVNGERYFDGKLNDLNYNSKYFLDFVAAPTDGDEMPEDGT